MANSSFVKGTIETPVSAENGGTGLSSLGSAGEALKVNSGATALEWGTAGGAYVFGGDGSDGALNVTSGTTNLDAASATILVKEYTSINISSGATLGLTNEAAGGTILILKSQGNVTIEGTIDLDGKGANKEVDGTSLDSVTGTAGEGGDNGNAEVSCTRSVNGGTGGNQYTQNLYLTANASLPNFSPARIISCGSGGGDGGNGYTYSSGTGGAGGTGGTGGGALLMECAGALDFDTAAEITANGTAGTSGSNGVNTWACGGGGGGGGNGGMVLIIYTTLTDNSGTITIKGGASGAGGNSDGAGTGSNRAGGGGGAGGGRYGSAGTNGTAPAYVCNNGGGANPGGAGTQGTGATGSGGGGGGAGSTFGSGYAGAAAPTTSDTDHYAVIENTWL